MKCLALAVQKLLSEQTDRQTRLKLLPTRYADGKNRSVFSKQDCDIETVLLSVKD